MKKIIRNLVSSFFYLIALAVLIFQISPPLQAQETDSQSPSVPQGFVADKTSYALPDTIRISNTPRGSAIEIYWLDNPETALNTDPESIPSNVYAVLVGDDGTVNIDAATLPPGRFVFVNTFEEGQCGGFYLSQCRARSDFLGEVEITITE